jgi:polyphosphate kinase
MASPGPDTLIRATFKRQMGRAPSAGAEDARQRRTGGRGREMRVLHGELVALQEWVKGSGARICVVFEGRDTAGKGGTIKRITERVSPRVFRVVALPAPTEREKSQMYIQRYLPHFPRR